MKEEFDREKEEYMSVSAENTKDQLQQLRQKLKESQDKLVQQTRADMLAKITELKNENALKLVEY